MRMLLNYKRRLTGATFNLDPHCTSILYIIQIRMGIQIFIYITKLDYDLSAVLERLFIDSYLHKLSLPVVSLTMRSIN